MTLIQILSNFLEKKSNWKTSLKVKEIKNFQIQFNYYFFNIFFFSNFFFIQNLSRKKKIRKSNNLKEILNQMSF